MTKPRKSLARRPNRAGVSVASARPVPGSTTLYAGYPDTRGRPAMVAPTGGSDRWWQEFDGLGQGLHLRVPRPGGG